MNTLGNYITSAQRLLHDATNRFWSVIELTDYANLARRKTAAETGATRQLAAAVPLSLVSYWSAGTAFSLNNRITLLPATGMYYKCTVPGTSGSSDPSWPTTDGATVVDGGVTWTAVTGPANSYPLTSIISGKTVIGLLDIYLNYSQSSRYPLFYFPYSSYARLPIVMYNSPGTPTVWSQFNRYAFISQWPNIDYTADFDCVVEPTDLVNLTDVDNEINSPFSNCVPFYMCYLAKLKDQRREQAEEFLFDYLRERNSTISSTIVRRLVGQ